MGMQVHFKLSDVLNGASVTISRETADGSIHFIGTINESISFRIESEDDLLDNDCWADVTHDRAIVNWLIDQRISFNAS